MLNEHDAARLWRQLFHGQAITEETLVKAESLVDELQLESPLRLRLATELEEIRRLHQKKQPKKTR